MPSPDVLNPGVSAQGLGVREAAYFRLQPEGYWMWQAYSLDEVLNGLNAQLNNGNIDEFLRLNKLSAESITSYWQAIAEFFIKAKIQGYLTPQETEVDGEQHSYYQYNYRDVDGKVGLTCAILDRRPGLPPVPLTIQFMRQVITADGFREDKVRIDTLAKDEGQIYNSGTWFSTYMERVCAIPPDNYHFFVEIDNYRGGLLQSISRVSGLENEPLMGIDVYSRNKPFIEIRQRGYTGYTRSERLISQEHFSRHFPLPT